MKGKRLIHTLHLFLERNAVKRTEYLRKNNVFRNIGKNCIIENRIVPLYSKLISIGDNVHLASGVHFITHDITHIMINNTGGGYDRLNEKIGCIEIGANVFVGAYSTILYNVKVGNNVIIGSGSIVTRDIPSNSIAAGVPARVIGTFDAYVEKRRNETTYPRELFPKAQEASDELADWCWSDFFQRRE